MNHLPAVKVPGKYKNIFSRKVHEGHNICDSCGKSIASAHKLKVHIRTVHEGLKDYKCETCGRAFSEAKSLKRHIESVHEGLKKHKCDHCLSSFSGRQSLKKHVEKVHQETLPDIKRTKEKHHCTFCGKAFYKQEAMLTHIQYAHEALKDKKCDTCGKIFTMAHALKKHISLVHRDDEEPAYNTTCGSFKTIQVPSDEQQQSTIQIGTSNYRLSCHICDKEFISETDLVVHLEKIHAFDLNQIADEQDNTENEENCKFCGRIFTFKMSYIRHIARHGVNEMKCYLCNEYKFQEKNRTKFESHMFEIHKISTAALKYAAHEIDCDLCNYSFSTDKRLTKHKAKNHPVIPIATKEIENEQKSQIPLLFKTMEKHICKAILENGLICGNSIGLEWVPRQTGGVEMKTKDFCGLHKSWVKSNRLLQMSQSTIQLNPDQKAKSRADVLKRDTYTIHEGHKDHKCEFCGKLFPDAENFKRHTHTINFVDLDLMGFIQEGLGEPEKDLDLINIINNLY